MDPTEEVAALRHELAALRRTVAELVRLLHESGATHASGRAGCASCGKPLGEDDPDLSLPRRGRVCVGCFERARGE